MTDLFTNHERFGDLDDWHRSVDELRAQGSVVWVDQLEAGFTPFWAVIGHEAVMAIERQPELFTNEPNAVLGRIAALKPNVPAGQSCVHWCKWMRLIIRTIESSPPTGSNRPASSVCKNALMS
jgi:hypothetical protein